METDKYLLTVVRYIHQNPLKAGMVKNLADYPWSSYREYTDGARICNPGFILDLFSGDKIRAKKEFIEFNSQSNDDKCLGYSQKLRLTDAEAADIIKTISGVNDFTEILGLAKDKRNDIIRKCKEQGASIRQIERLTGISFGVIRSI